MIKGSMYDIICLYQDRMSIQEIVSNSTLELQRNTGLIYENRALGYLPSHTKTVICSIVTMQY